MSGASRILNRLGDLAFLRPFTGAWTRSMRGRVTCLLYHRVDEPGAFRWLDRGGSPVIAPDDLREELAFLQRIGATFHTFRDLRSGWFPESDEIAVVVTFDDGFRSNYTSGLEVLRNLGIPAVFFQTAGIVGATDLLWEHALYWRTRDDQSRERLGKFLCTHAPSLAANGTAVSARRLRDTVSSTKIEGLLGAMSKDLGDRDTISETAAAVYPDAEMIRRARKEGHEIGAHGDRHYMRATIDEAIFDADLARCSGTLEGILGEAPRAFSYPFNSYLPGDDAIVARHFDQGATVDKRRIERDTDPMWLPRFTWPGPAKNPPRLRRWLLRGTI